MDHIDQHVIVMCDRCAIPCSLTTRSFNRNYYWCPSCHTEVSLIIIEPRPSHEARYSSTFLPHANSSSREQRYTPSANTYNGNTHNGSHYALPQRPQRLHEHTAMYPHTNPNQHPTYSDANLNGVTSAATYGATPFHNYYGSLASDDDDWVNGVQNDIYDPAHGMFANPSLPQRGSSNPSRFGGDQLLQHHRDMNLARVSTNSGLGYDHAPTDISEEYNPQENRLSSYSSNSSDPSSTTSTNPHPRINGNGNQDIPPVAFTTRGETLLLGEEFIVPTAAEAQQEAGANSGPARVFSEHDTAEQDEDGEGAMVEIEENVEEIDLSMSGAC
ncbi:uncharacterized protein GGS22DRAFT_183260 [Annulohypoxylon maeteangense]|uniref:uncharacterized protein n=1 Tax=Annulohypoxylon maeteangense TaxID=1927788 RepID=UPI0020086979|nr:uncharacterized protein GGS22DRAFT_183260 [Annulohypoxylon maeteangense]KAI0889911.1 hypothetical protein GGS22DRAFT_183260 [Annulohypoxylon maeteangense]